jgi:hypothetical protein
MKHFLKLLLLAGLCYACQDPGNPVPGYSANTAVSSVDTIVVVNSEVAHHPFKSIPKSSDRIFQHGFQKTVSSFYQINPNQVDSVIVYSSQLDTVKFLSLNKAYFMVWASLSKKYAFLQDVLQISSHSDSLLQKLGLKTDKPDLILVIQDEMKSSRVVVTILGHKISKVQVAFSFD